jgi:hypothetical protein
MKLTPFALIALIFCCNNAHAQFTPAPANDDQGIYSTKPLDVPNLTHPKTSFTPDPRMIKQLSGLAIHKYEVVGVSTITIEGQAFTQLSYAKKAEFAHEGTTTEEWLLAANMVGDMGAAYAFLDATWDKEQHFLVGYLFANVTNGIFQLILPQDMKHRRLVAALLGFGMSALLGAGKEYYDSLHPLTHTCDVKDFLATAAGGAVGTFTLSFDLRKALFGRY